MFRNDELTVEQVRRLRPTGIVLSPGPGRPEHAGMMDELVRACAEEIPMLGVCLGHQAIAQVFGAVIGLCADPHARQERRRLLMTVPRCSMAFRRPLPPPGITAS